MKTCECPVPVKWHASSTICHTCTKKITRVVTGLGPKERAALAQKVGEQRAARTKAGRMAVLRLTRPHSLTRLDADPGHYKSCRKCQRRFGVYRRGKEVVVADRRRESEMVGDGYKPLFQTSA